MKQIYERVVDVLDAVVEGDAARRVTQLMQRVVETLRVILVADVDVHREHRALVQPGNRHTRHVQPSENYSGVPWVKVTRCGPL